MGYWNPVQWATKIQGKRRRPFARGGVKRIVERQDAPRRGKHNKSEGCRIICPGSKSSTPLTPSLFYLGGQVRMDRSSTGTCLNLSPTQVSHTRVFESSDGPPCSKGGRHWTPLLCFRFGRTRLVSSSVMQSGEGWMVRGVSRKNHK